MKVARIIRIEGRVQGVWFRDWAVETASALCVTGWVRNRRDGSVEAFAVGNPEALDRFVERLHEGPTAAQVAKVEVEPAALQDFTGFTRAPTA
jgi:acylphosphatase